MKKENFLETLKQMKLLPLFFYNIFTIRNTIEAPSLHFFYNNITNNNQDFDFDNFLLYVDEYNF